MAVLQRTRQRTPVLRPTAGSGGGGGNGLGSWRKFGEDDGSYSAAQNKLQQGRGAFTGLLDKFTKEVGVNPYGVHLVSSSDAGKADKFAKTQVPQYVENAKTFYKSAAEASSGDLKIKQSWANDFAIPHSKNLVEQNEVDHKVARQQMENVAAQAVQQWHTTEAYLFAQGSLEQLKIQTSTL